MGRRHEQPNPELLSLETAAESELMSSARELPRRRRFTAVMGTLARPGQNSLQEASGYQS